MAKVKQDDKGIFIQTGGYIFRPGPVPGYSHALRMDDGGLKVGDIVKAHHIAGDLIAKIKLNDGSVVYWYTLTVSRFFQSMHRNEHNSFYLN